MGATNDLHSDVVESRTLPPSVDVLGIRVHNVTMHQAISLIRDMALSGASHHVIPVNPELIMAAQKDESFRHVLNSASLVLPDGVGILVAARLAGLRVKERVTGVDTVCNLANIAQEHGLRLFLLGAASGVAERVAERLQKEHPGLEIVGTYAGSPDPKEEEEICSRIRAANPDILLVAYGAPQQELWVARNSERLNVPVAMCVGGTFDFISGFATRAPGWMQRLGLEWMFRLIQEPRRFRRMLALPRFLLEVVRNA
jgi:N-acetylglucosaminyldiphosphoundecaprenol N-acetyl-beta-D-mannosaminyltransferase